MRWGMEGRVQPIIRWSCSPYPFCIQTWLEPFQSKSGCATKWLLAYLISTFDSSSCIVYFNAHICLICPSQHLFVSFSTILITYIVFRWFHGKISRDQAEQLLFPREDGLFLVRESTNFPGDYTLCVCYQGKVEHYRVIYKDSKLTIDEEEYFTNLAELVEVTSLWQVSANEFSHQLHLIYFGQSNTI